MLPSAPAQAAPGTLPHTWTRLKNKWLLYEWFLSLQECELMKTKPLHLLTVFSEPPQQKGLRKQE